jgi:uncharacterized protein (TIGR03435 family)
MALCAPALFAQSAARLEFEVASVKPAAPIGGPSSVHIGIRIDGAQFSCTSYSLKDYIGFAYRVKTYQVIGPEWVAHERFEISAKLPNGATREQAPQMLQALLEDRFKLKLHHDQKEFPVYALVVAKGGPRVKESAAEADAAAPRPNISVAASGGPQGVGVDLGGGSFFHFGNDKFEAGKLTMARLAESLSLFTDRPIVDMTGLNGNYDFTLQFSPEDYRAMLIRSAINNGVQLPPEAMRALEISGGDSLFSSIQLLGLKLEARKAPLDVIVVDSAEKTPTDN